jgi:myo-inositol-1(or 4)-monophosphatase
MSWRRELTILTKAIRMAGEEALRFAAGGFEVHQKPDASPVTSADLAVNDLLQRHLLEAFPEDGWLSEETSDNGARLAKQRVWIIDPIDGTKAFIRKHPEYCVSVALVENGRPVVAAVYNPATDELLTAVRGAGVSLNEQPLGRATVSHDRPLIALSPWEQRLGRFKAVEPHVTSRPIHSIAWAMALAASGRIHAVATLEPENEWDVAAGALLIEEAGGSAHDHQGRPLEFNRPSPRYAGLIALSRDCPDTVARPLRDLHLRRHTGL